MRRYDIKIFATFGERNRAGCGRAGVSVRWVLHVAGRKRGGVVLVGGSRRYRCDADVDMGEALCI